MAGWKLRKDKTSAETTDAEAEAAAPPEPQSGNNLHENDLHENNLHEETVPPSFASSTENHFTDLDFDSDFEEPKFEQPKLEEAPLEQGERGDGPLTLVDYTEPETEHFAGTENLSETEYAPFGSAAHHAQVFDMPAPIFEMPAPTVIETAPPVIEAAAPVLDVIPTAEDDFQQRLRTGRFEAGELAPPPAGGFSNAGIPSVSPFVLDTPPPAAPPAAAPQLIVHVGRLSAAFDITKDVTTIGRPDSAMHYYPDVEIETDDAISRRHAEVVKRENGYYLVDTGSTNGTRLNGKTVPAHEEHLLAYGDRIHVGERTEIVFE